MTQIADLIAKLEGASEDRRPAVYGASKLRDAPIWKALRAQEPRIRWTARWPDLVGNVEDTETNSAMFWLHDLADVAKADALILLAPAQDQHLRGALIEAGFAIAKCKPVYCVGEHPDFGTWQFHPLVYRVPDVASALRHILGDWS